MVKNIDRGYKQDTIKENYEKILTVIMPIIPHFSSECLEMIGQEIIRGLIMIKK
jgi:leucyl-tRNA synthetase